MAVFFFILAGIAAFFCIGDTYLGNPMKGVGAGVLAVFFAMCALSVQVRRIGLISKRTGQDMDTGTD